MSRFVIVSMPAAEAAPLGGFGRHLRADDAAVDAGCAWLLKAGAQVDDPEEALRGAVREFFASPEGRRVRAGEAVERIGWCDAIGWVPDEIWERHGLTVFRHPDVERIILDDEEDLAEELVEEGVTSAAPAPAAAPPA